MRDIKFRAKTKKNEWVYGTYTFTYPNEHRIHGKDRTSIEVNPDTLGQFTGLNDSDGNEIYEGDIVRFEGSGFRDFGCVTWNDAGYFFVDGSGGKSSPIGDYIEWWFKFILCCTYTVNGNIHDNPEGLKLVNNS